MIKVDYFMSHGSPWTFLGHNRLNKIVKKFNVQLNMYPVNYGEIFPISGGLPVSKRPLQRQKIRLQELKRWAEFLNIDLIPEPKFFPSKSLLPSLLIIAAKIKKTNKDFELASSIMNALWVKELNIDEENTLKNIMDNLELDSEDLLSFAKSQECESIFKEYTKIAIEKNVFGAPTFIIDDQIYWGQDRLDFIERHLLKLIKSQ
jgi:2-hydroxychromene-2-carboxylate isomerase